MHKKKNHHILRVLHLVVFVLVSFHATAYWSVVLRSKLHHTEALIRPISLSQCWIRWESQAQALNQMKLSTSQWCRHTVTKAHELLQRLLRPGLRGDTLTYQAASSNKNAFISQGLVRVKNYSVLSTSPCILNETTHIHVSNDLRNVLVTPQCGIRNESTTYPSVFKLQVHQHPPRQHLVCPARAATTEPRTHPPNSNVLSIPVVLAKTVVFVSMMTLAVICIALNNLATPRMV